MSQREAGYRTVAALHNVTVEHLKAVMESRRRYRLAQFYRIRSRVKGKRTHPGARANSAQYLLVGEGRFHELLKILGMTEKTFALFAGLHPENVRKWAGHPLQPWPIVLLEALAQNANMAKKLMQHGWNPDDFKAGQLPPAPTGRYPRTAEQGRALIRAAGKAVEKEAQ